MKKQLLVLLVASSAALLSACDERFDNFILDINQSPTITFIVNGSPLSTYKDSLKISVKTGAKSVPGRVQLADPERGRLTCRVTSSNDLTVSQSGQPKSELTLDELNTAQFELASAKVGDYTIQFSAVDPFEKEASVSMNLFVFNNLKPVAKFSVNKNAINSPNEYALDATESFDQDRYQGGAVKYYYWKINGVQEITDKPIYRIIFDKPGVYEVVLTVQDNDGEKSSEVKQQITI